MDYPYDLGSYSRKVTTTSSDAQRWFDRGLNWCFGYHHEEAVACFGKALEIHSPDFLPGGAKYGDVPGADAATVLPFRSVIFEMPGLTTMPSAP